MDNIRNNQQNVPNIFLEDPVADSTAPKLPNQSKWLMLQKWFGRLKFRIQQWWVKLRYGNRPGLSAAQISSRPWMKYIKTYWWAGAIVVLVIVAALSWWFVGVQREETWEQATSYYRKADYQSAAPLLMKLPLPDNAEQLRIYGQTMQATNHPEKAIEAYQKLYDREKDPFARLSLGNVYNQQQNYDEAIKAYQGLIDDNPNYIQAYVNLATTYRLQGKNAEAIDVGKKGLQNNANSVALAELVVSLTMDNPESDEHKQALETLKRINPEDPLLQ